MEANVSSKKTSDSVKDIERFSSEQPIRKRPRSIKNVYLIMVVGGIVEMGIMV